MTVGPNAQLIIDKFVYDPSTQKGELAINASKGVFRVIGGRISKTTPITVTTPSSTMGIRGGIMVIGVDPGNATTPPSTTSIFVFGNSMTVTANGVTQTVTVPGLQVIANAGSPPGAPTVVVMGSLSAALGALVGSPQALAAAVTLAINTLVANNLNNAAVLANITNLIQTIINQNAVQTLTTQNTNLNVLVVTENKNQTQASPN